MQIARGSGPKYANFAVGASRNEAKNLDCSGRILGRISVPNKLIVGVVERVARNSELRLVLLTSRNYTLVQGG
jgi:hypothetical protein